MKKLLLTGGSGFLGNSIAQTLEEDFEVHTLGRNPGNDIPHDLAKSVPSLPAHYDLVVHAAGKAHTVPKTEAEKKDFFRVNAQGTQNLIKALDNSGVLPKHLVFISTVAVYGIENGENIAEGAPLLGDTPYARSKILAEEFLIDWEKKQGVPVLILRLPLIAGPQPPGNVGKMIEGIRKKRYLSIGGGKARRSVVMAEDVAKLIRNSNLCKGTYNLTDGYHPTFRELEILISQQLNTSRPPALPKPLARVLGWAGDLLPFSPVNSSTIAKMVNDLTFADTKARQELNWQPQRVTEAFCIE